MAGAVIGGAAGIDREGEPPGAPGSGRVEVCVDGDRLRHGGRDEEEGGGSGGGAVEIGNPATLGIGGIWLNVTS